MPDDIFLDTVESLRFLSAVTLEAHYAALRLGDEKAVTKTLEAHYETNRELHDYLFKGALEITELKLSQDMASITQNGTVRIVIDVIEYVGPNEHGAPTFRLGGPTINDKGERIGGRSSFGPYSAARLRDTKKN